MTFRKSTQLDNRKDAYQQKIQFSANKNKLQANPTVAPAWTHALSSQPALSLQPKLTINEPGDKYEQEADRVAHNVMNTPADPQISGQTDILQRKTRDQTVKRLLPRPLLVKETAIQLARPLNPRQKIKVSRIEGTRYYFFGDNDFTPENEEVDSRKTQAYVPKEKGEGNYAKPTTISVSYITVNPYNGSDAEKKWATGIMNFLRAAAAIVRQGDGGVYCTQGRERSAFHVFAALYIDNGYSKVAAKAAVMQAIESSGNKTDQTTALLNSAWFTSLPETTQSFPSWLGMAVVGGVTVFVYAALKLAGVI